MADGGLVRIADEELVTLSPSHRTHGLPPLNPYPLNLSSVATRDTRMSLPAGRYPGSHRQVMDTPSHSARADTPCRFHRHSGGRPPWPSFLHTSADSLPPDKGIGSQKARARRVTAGPKILNRCVFEQAACSQPFSRKSGLVMRPVVVQHSRRIE